MESIFDAQGAIGPLQLRSRGAHCDRALMVEVQRCSLGSWRKRLANSLAKAEKEEKEEEEMALIKSSSNPHLAGGEQFADSQGPPSLGKIVSDTFLVV